MTRTEIIKALKETRVILADRNSTKEEIMQQIIDKAERGYGTHYVYYLTRICIEDLPEIDENLEKNVANFDSYMIKELKNMDRFKPMYYATVLAPVPVDLNADPFIYESETGHFVKLSPEGLRDIIYSEHPWRYNMKLEAWHGEYKGILYGVQETNPGEEPLPLYKFPGGISLA